MPIDIVFEQTDHEGKRARSAEPLQIVGEYLENELADIATATIVADRCMRVMNGLMPEWSAGGMNFGLVLNDRQAFIEKADGTKIVVQIGDFREALLGWHTFLSQGLSPAMKTLMSGPVLAENERQELSCYVGAIDRLIEQRQLLSEPDSNVLLHAFYRLIVAEQYEDAQKYADLFLQLDSERPGTAFGDDLFAIGVHYLDCEKPDKARVYLRRALQWQLEYNPINEANGHDYQFQVIQAYCAVMDGDCLQDEIVPDLYEETIEFARAYGQLNAEMMRKTGLMQEFLKASGLGAFADGLRAMVAQAQGASYENPEQAKPASTTEQLQSELKRRLPRYPDALALCHQLRNMAHNLQKNVDEVAHDESEHTPFFQLLKQFIDLQTDTIEKLCPDPDHTIDTSPVATREVFEETAISDQALSRIVETGRRRHNPRAGSPNDEPVMHWQLYKYSNLLMSHPELAQKLQRAGASFIMDFHEDQHAAVPKYIEQLEDNLSQRPAFLIQCLSELAKLYEHALRPETAALFGHALSIWKDEPTTGEGDIAPEGLAVYMPEENYKIADTLYRKLKDELQRRNIVYSYVGMTTPETLAEYPGKEYARIKVDGPDLETLEQLIVQLLGTIEVPMGVVIAKGKRIEAWNAARR